MKPLYESLSDSEVATLIAEKMGWYLCIAEGDTTASLFWDNSPKPFLDKEWNPRKHENLYQCWVFEEWISNEERPFPDSKINYLSALEHITNVGSFADTVGNDFALLHATADQRCKAFLITVGECR